MTIYKLRVPDSLVVVVRRMHPDLKRKVKASLGAISRDPHAGKPLREEFEGLRSFRFGRFRIVYRIIGQETTVDIIAIGPRANIYEETYRLVSRDSRH